VTGATMTSPAPRVYAACLSCYNGGRLVGAWIECDQEPEEIGEEIAAMLRGDHPAMFCGTEHLPHPYGLPCEEWAFHDYEGFPRGMSEYESTEALAAFARGVADHGDTFSEWYDYRGGEYEPGEWVEQFEEQFRGEFESKEDYAAHLWEDCGMLVGVPEAVRGYIDYASYAHDLECSGEILFAEPGYGRVLVFEVA
jgi:antirestriction protein